MAFSIIRNDITKVTADAIVNTANPRPVYGHGTDTAIYKAAGEEQLLEARRTIGNIERGQAVETPAFALHAKYIIHTVGPRWKGGDCGEFETLKSCYNNSLQLALKLGCTSIAFPLISSGSYGFPKDKALQIALSSIEAFLMENEMEVILVVFDKKAFELSGQVVDNIREYVDSHYVEEAHNAEHFYESEASYDDRRRREYDEQRYEKRPSTQFSLKKPRPRPTEPEDEIETANYSVSAYMEAPEVPPMPEAAPCVGAPLAPSPKESAAAEEPKVNIGSFIDETLAKSFRDKLFELIDERGLTGPQVYKNYITKQVYSNILSKENYQPTKATAIALCLSLHLDLEQTDDLLARAGYTLSPARKADIVIKGCIKNRMYDPFNINSILFDYGCPLINDIK